MAIEKGIGAKRRQLLVSEMVDRWGTWRGGGENGRQAKEETWGRMHAMFLSQEPEYTDADEYRASRFEPESNKAVMNFVSQVGRAMFPSDRFFTAIGDNRQAQEQANLRTNFMSNRLDNAHYTHRYKETHLPQLAVFGNSPWMAFWDTTRSRRRRTQEGIQPYAFIGSDGQLQFYMPPMFTYDGPAWEPLDLFNYVQDPAVRNQQCAIKVYRYYIPKSELVKRAEESESGYARYDKKAVRKMLDEDAPVADEEGDNDAESRSTVYGTNRVIHGKRSDMAEIFYIHGDFQLGNDFYENYVLEVGNRGHTLRCESNPMESGLAPMGMDTLVPVSGEIYGLGILEPAESLQDRINVRANQIDDFATMSNNFMLVINQDAVVDPANIVTGPGAVIMAEGDPKEAVMKLSPDPSGYAALGELQNLTRAFVDATHSHISFGAQRTETATASAISASLAESVTGHITRHLEHAIETHHLPFFDEAEKQFFDPDNNPFARFQDEDGEWQYKKVGAEVIYQNYTWKAQGSGAVQSKVLAVQQLLQVMVAVAQTPAAQGTDFEYAARRAVEMLGFRDADKIVPGIREMAEKAQRSGVPPALGAQGGGAAPGSSPPPGMAPSGRGALPNAGGGLQFAEAGRSNVPPSG